MSLLGPDGKPVEKPLKEGELIAFNVNDRAKMLVEISKGIPNPRDVVVVSRHFYQKVITLLANYDVLAAAMTNYLHLTEAHESTLTDEQKAEMGANYQRAVERMRATLLNSLGGKLYTACIYLPKRDEQHKSKQNGEAPGEADPPVDPG